MKKTIIYTRVSTDKQTHDSQLSELQDYCTRRRWDCANVYSDQASGAKVGRPELERLLVAVRRGKVGRIVIFKLDRLGRSLTHLALILGELQAHGVALICSSQGIDTSEANPAGRLQLGVLMAVAEFERELIRERVLAGLQAAKKRGVKLGRPRMSRGMRDAVRQLADQGLSTRAIARQLGLPKSSVGDVCRNAKR